ncbi:GTPase [Phytohabitans flavus]|uniref:GTPase n=1 Tax=Phytohabitans flavus TaxID=1076124 RepID=UPI003626EE44
MTLLSRLRGEEQIDADRLVERVDAIDRFVHVVAGQLPEQRLIGAHTVVERAGARLALSRDHTVVALAGATGSGKSSLFNALARLDLSPVGVRRPTTGMAHACVWGNLQGANRLLDWVGVLPRHRFIRESALDGNDEAALRGLVLLDLPDFDSVERSHRLEVDRLLGLVDLVVWVVDPQKYADRVVHTRYLQAFHNHKDVTVVVLNQADRLPPAEVTRVLDDLRKLLDADDLDGVPLLATAALHQPAIADLRGLLEHTVAERQASLRRLSGDLDTVADQLSDVVGPAVAEDEIDRDTVHGLTDALSVAAGVPAVAEATERAYQHRAAQATGWPVVRGWRRLRADPLRSLHLPEGPVDPSTPVGTTSVPDPDSARRAAVSLAVRSVADRAAGPLPAPWATAVNTAARSRLRDVPDALDQAVARTNLHMDHSPSWWRAVNGLQWLVTVAAVAGLLWLVAGYALRVLGLPPLDYPKVGAVPLPTVMLLGGLLVGLLVGVLVRPLIRQASRRARRRAENRLRTGVAEVAREYIVAPVRAVLHSYAEAREALESARS